MNLIFPQFALSCLEKIEENGFEAYFVGGCVRDMLLGRNFYDIDIATDAKPEDITKIFKKTIPTGIKHGTVTVIIDKNSVEVTTYRSEGGYLDGRHPDFVIFKNEVYDDLARRDFTVNAIAYHPRKGLIDLFGGIDDLNNRIIKCVNNPETRFNEDVLRILRAYRFASQLDFKIEEETEMAAISLSHKLKTLSGERVLFELKKLINGKKPAVLSKLLLCGCFEFFGINSNATDFSFLNRLPKMAEYRLPIFLNICGFDEVLLKNNLKIDNDSLKKTCSLFDIIKMEIPKTKREIKLFLSIYDTDIFETYLEYLLVMNNNISKLKKNYLEIINYKEPYKLSQLDINGNDIEKLGFSGKEVGIQLNRLLQLVIDNPSLNKKELLISKLKN